jgi:hypothetical protein
MGSIDNHGLIVGGWSGSADLDVGAEPGGAGVRLSGGSLTNTGVIIGGHGGALSGSQVYYYGPGGAGVVLSGSACVNRGTITGGAGGNPGRSGDIDESWGAGVTVENGSIANYGLIVGGAGSSSTHFYSGHGGGAGVALSGYGSLTNAGTILGGAPSYSSDGEGVGGYGVTTADNDEILNTGVIVGGGGSGSGVGLYGGRLINKGVIEGGSAYSSGEHPFAGIGIDVNGGSVLNYGTVTGGSIVSGGNHSGFGLDLADGLVVNGAAGSTGAVISGYDGVTVDGSPEGGTVVNFATICGFVDSVVLDAYTDRLIAEAGSTWIGAVKGGSGTLELAGGTGAITGLGATGMLSGAEAMTFSGFGSYVIDVGASWTLSGTNALSASQSVSVAGALTLSGTLASSGTISGAGGSTITLKKADIIGGTLASSGSVTVRGGGNILDGTTATLTSHASTTVADKGSLTIEGALVNDGEISLAGVTATTKLIVGAAGATLSGGGTVAMGSYTFGTLVGGVTTATLTNVDNTISGGGILGSGKLTLVNQAAGVIEQTGSAALSIATGKNVIANAGTIEATGAGGATIAGAVANSGVLATLGDSDMTVEGAVTGTGTADFDGGTLTFASTFDENVTFTGGQLVLAHSRSYTGTISGFSQTDGSSVDLRDIRFVSASEATFSGTTTGGVLTVVGGGHTATISLAGDYLGATFTAISDGRGGTDVQARDIPPMAPVPRAFVEAMAGMAGMSPTSGEPSHQLAGSHTLSLSLALPTAAAAQIL